MAAADDAITRTFSRRAAAGAAMMPSICRRQRHYFTFIYALARALLLMMIFAERHADAACHATPILR
jgi:hypothetical protein